MLFGDPAHIDATLDCRSVSCDLEGPERIRVDVAAATADLARKPHEQPTMIEVLLGMACGEMEVIQPRG